MHSLDTWPLLPQFEQASRPASPAPARNRKTDEALSKIKHSEALFDFSQLKEALVIKKQVLLCQAS